MQVFTNCEKIVPFAQFSCRGGVPGGKEVREGGVFHSLWETLWKVRQIKGFLRVFHKENFFFLWKTFLFPFENFCGRCHCGEKIQNI